MLHIHTVAWSEPAFLCITFTSLLLFCRSSARGGWLLAAAGLCAGAALSTRYAGVALLPPYMLCIVVCTTAPVRRRARDTLIFLCAAALPLGGWLLYIRAIEHTTSDRPLVFHSPGGASVALLTVLAFAAAGLVHRFRRERVREPSAAEAVLSLWILAFLMTYCAFVFFAICFLDALTPVDARILSPALVFGGLILIQLIWSPHRCAGKGFTADEIGAPHAWRWFATGALVIACARGGAVFSLARQRHDAGYGYTSRAWRRSPALDWIDSLPAGIRIYSNAPELIAFRNRRTTLPLPTKFSPTTLLPNAHLDRDVAVFQDALRHGGIVVYFPGSPRSYLLSAADLEQACRVPVMLRLADGVVYGYSTYLLSPSPHRVRARRERERNYALRRYLANSNYRGI